MKQPFIIIDILYIYIIYIYVRICTLVLISPVPFAQVIPDQTSSYYEIINVCDIELCLQIIAHVKNKRDNDRMATIIAVRLKEIRAINTK